MASKYIIAPHHKHVFNPAAAAAVILGLSSNLLPAIWWIGSPSLLPVTLVFWTAYPTQESAASSCSLSFLAVGLLVATVVGLARQE